MVGGSVTEDMAAYVSSDSFQFSNNLKIQLQLPANRPLLLVQK